MARSEMAMNRRIKTWIGLALFCAAQPVFAGASDQLNRFLKSTRSLYAQFTQTTQQKNAPPQQSDGILILSRPGKFRWEITKPYKQLIVGDGRKVWMYDPDLRQATVKKADAALSGTPAVLLSGKNRAFLEQTFVLREIETKEGGQEWIEAVPRERDTGFEKIRIGFSGNLPRVMEIQDNFGQTTVLLFSEIKHNPKLDPSLLSFAPPDGTDIVGE